MILENKTIYKFQKDDFPPFQKFIEENFWSNYILTDQRFFEWQYAKSPECIQDFESKGNVSMLLLKDNSDIFGYLGILPFKYKIFDFTKRNNVYANLFVKKGSRALGTGILLIREGMRGADHACAIGYEASTFLIYQKLGDWREMGSFSRYLVVFNSEAVDGLLKNQDIKNESKNYQFKPKNTFTPRVNYQYIKSFDSDFDVFWKVVREKYKITIERNSRYLNWRYANHPSFDYSILAASNDKGLVGFLIYRFEKVADFRIARIIDFISFDDFELDLLNRFILDASRSKSDMVDFMFSGDYYHQNLKKAGFFEAEKTALSQLPILLNPISYKQKRINFMVFNKDKNIDQDQFYNSSNWYLTKGDSDQDRPNPH